MYFTIEFKNGTTIDVALSGSHTLQVITPQNAVQEAYGLNDVADIQFHHGNPPEPAPVIEQIIPGDPAPADDKPAAVTADAPAGAFNVDVTAGIASTASNNATTSVTWTSDAAIASVASDVAAGNHPVVPGDQVVADAAEPEIAIDESAAHADAVAQAQTAVEQASVVEDTADYVGKALADVEQALVQWPDSEALLDAKAQLEQIGGQAAS